MGLDPMRSLVDVLPHPACAHRDGHVVHANDSFAAALGYGDATALRSAPVETLLAADARSTFLERVARVSESSPSAYPVDVDWLTRSGKTLRMRTGAARIMIDGEPAILELARSALEANVPETQVAAATRLASVGTLAAGVAHEINNPLTYVLANLDYIREQLLMHKDVLTASAFDDLDNLALEAKAGAERVARTVRSLRVFSRIDEDKRTPVDVVRLVEAALALAANELRHRARVVKIYRPVPSVLGDEARLTQVFFSLLINAAQAIPDGRADDNQIDVKTWSEGGRAIIEFRDSGEGIRPENLGRIFDPFFTTKPLGLGTGLGLAICHGTVQDLGGEIVVESTVGVGATFRVSLPGAPDVAAQRAAPERVSTGRGRSGKIIVIDDDAAVGTAIRRALGRRHDVLTTTSGSEAVERIRGGERFDLILCDLMMPMLSGMDVHAALTTLCPEQAERMVFITGGAFTVRSREFLDSVPNERFDKPFDASRLRLLAKTMVDDLPRASSST